MIRFTRSIASTVKTQLRVRSPILGVRILPNCLDVSNTPPNLIAINMSFGIDERTPLLLCTDSGSVRKILACKISNGRVEQTETVPYNKMGFTSKRCCNDLMTVDQFGVISRFQLNGMTISTPQS